MKALKSALLTQSLAVPAPSQTGAWVDGGRPERQRRDRPLAIRQEPGFDAAVACVAPHDITDAVVVEVTDPHQLRARRMRADIDTAGPVAVVHQPHVDVVG